MWTMAGAILIVLFVVFVVLPFAAVFVLYTIGAARLARQSLAPDR